MKRELVVAAVAMVAVVVLVPFMFDEESDAAIRNWTAEYTLNYNAELNEWGKINHENACDESDDSYTFTIEGKPDWMNIEREKVADNDVRYYFTGVADEVGDWTVVITERTEGLFGLYEDKAVTTVYVHVVIPDGSYMVTFDANGGQFSNGADTYTTLVAYEDYLPVATHPDGRDLVGWYDSDGNFVGKSGASFDAKPNETYHAVWGDIKLIMDKSTDTVEAENGERVRYTIGYHSSDGKDVTGVTFSYGDTA